MSEPGYQARERAKEIMTIAGSVGISAIQIEAAIAAQLQEYSEQDERNSYQPDSPI